MIPVADVYGDLRVFGQKVCICISSGQTSEKILHLDKHWHNSLGGFENPSDPKLYGDQILEWDTTSDTSRTIDIMNPICVSLPGLWSEICVKVNIFAWFYSMEPSSNF